MLIKVTNTQVRLEGKLKLDKATMLSHGGYVRTITFVITQRIFGNTFFCFKGVGGGGGQDEGEGV